MLPAALSPGVDEASSRNEYQIFLLGGKGGRFIGLTTLSLSRADCPEILTVSTSSRSKDLSRPVIGQLYFFTSFLKGIYFMALTHQFIFVLIREK
jgi:hypothetical protein